MFTCETIQARETGSFTGAFRLPAWEPKRDVSPPIAASVAPGRRTRLRVRHLVRKIDCEVYDL
jgi:hypothetical protein